MNAAERFAIKSALNVLELKLDAAFGYVRQDERGAVRRKVIAEIKDQIKIICEFLDSSLIEGEEK